MGVDDVIVRRQTLVVRLEGYDLRRQVFLLGVELVYQAVLAHEHIYEGGGQGGSDHAHHYHHGLQASVGLPFEFLALKLGYGIFLFHNRLFFCFDVP